MHLDQIVGALVEKATTHKWIEISIDEYGEKKVTHRKPPKLACLARRMLARKLTAPPAEWIRRRMVLGAIKKAERESCPAAI